MTTAFDPRRRLQLGRFDDPQVERTFLRQYRAGGLRYLAWAAGLGLLAYTAFAVEHGMRSGIGLLADSRELLAMAARLFVALVCLAIVLAIVHAPRWVLARYVPLMSAALLLLLIPVALFAPAAEPVQHAHFRPLIGFTLTAFGLVVLLRLPVVVSAACSLICLSVLIASLLAQEHWSPAIIPLMIYPTTAVLFGLVISHVIEYRERALFAVAVSARRLSAERTRLIGELAHDMRGPLAAIGNEVDDLQRQAGALPAADMARRLATVEESIVHTRAYLEHLLAWCQAAGSDQRLQVGPVSLELVVQRLKAGLAAHAARSGVAFIAELSAEARRLSLLSHPTELYSILHNLIDNAIKYRVDRPGTHAYVRLRALRRGGRCEIEVLDNGIGIDPQGLRHIWDIGYRISRLGGAPAGTGLGLAIVKARVDRLERHSIGVSSEPGVGTRFWLRVPLADEPESFVADLPAVDHRAVADDELLDEAGVPAPAAQPDEPARAAAGARLLIVGVDAQRWPGLRRRLGRFGDGAAVVADAEGLAALLALSISSFDVMVLDGGDESADWRLIEAVRRDHGFEVPAIVLRGSYRRWMVRAGSPKASQVRHLARLASAERLRRVVEMAVAESLERQRLQLEQAG